MQLQKYFYKIINLQKTIIFNLISIIVIKYCEYTGVPEIS